MKKIAITFLLFISLSACSSEEPSITDVRKALELDRYNQIKEFVEINLGKVTTYRKDEYTYVSNAELIIHDKSRPKGKMDFDAIRRKLMESGIPKEEAALITMGIAFVPWAYIGCVFQPGATMVVAPKAITFNKSNDGWIVTKIEDTQEGYCK